MSRLIYLDNAATTKVLPEVLAEMIPYYTENYGNPAAVYGFAGKAQQAVVNARDRVAKVIGAEPGEIYFTAGGSEADNWALKAVAEAYASEGKHLITTTIEHHAVLHTMQWLEEKGYEITYIGVNEDGKVRLDELEKAIRPDTILISVMTANNEIGTIEPIREIGLIAKKHQVLFHTDAVQAFGSIPIDVGEMNIDLLSVSAHKIHGPKGVGCLYIRKSVRIGSFIHGGAQERRRRAGTHNVPGIAGMGKAAEIAGQGMHQRAEKLSSQRDYLIERVLKEIPYVRLNGHRQERLPNNASFCFQFINGETLLISLDQAGICASSGSACTSGSLEPSHVLLAIGLPEKTARGSLRLTLSEETTREEIDETIDNLKKIIKRLREMSPEYKNFIVEIQE